MFKEMGNFVWFIESPLEQWWMGFQDSVITAHSEIVLFLFYFVFIMVAAIFKIMFNFVGKNFILGLNKDSIVNIRVNKIIDSIDYFILVLVIFNLVGDFILIFSGLINHIIDFFYININVDGLYMVEPNTPVQSNSTTINTTNTKIIHEDGSISNTVRTLFIYGTGALRLSLMRGAGSPGSRGFVIASTIASDALSRVLNNTINDPAYVKNHVENWRAVWKSTEAGEANIVVDDQTFDKLKSVSDINDNFNLSPSHSDDITKILSKGFFENFKYILEPVHVDYSNSVLADQIYDISILMFILAVLITGLITVLLLNVFIYINMDRIINFFNNSFIRRVLSINKKFMTLELIMLGSSILYFMYTLTNGILFIATHPIIIN